MTELQAKSLAKALKKKFRGKVEVELVDRPGRYRFTVISQAFDSMPHLDRQDAMWEIVDETLPRAATLDVSMILAYAPADLLLK